MEKRKIIDSCELWRSLEIIRNTIAHEYLITESTTALKDAFINAPILIGAVAFAKNYCLDIKLID
ncbi:MAG: hypothetical protein HQK49_20245 [Oligoflexia bacterium]|nr:hypothetical protein [Oligoflexia bacterium]